MSINYESYFNLSGIHDHFFQKLPSNQKNHFFFVSHIVVDGKESDGVIVSGSSSVIEFLAGIEIIEIFEN